MAHTPQREQLDAAVETNAAERADLLVRWALLGRDAKELILFEARKLGPQAGDVGEEEEVGVEHDDVREPARQHEVKQRLVKVDWARAGRRAAQPLEQRLHARRNVGNRVHENAPLWHAKPLWADVHLRA